MKHSFALLLGTILLLSTSVYASKQPVSMQSLLQELIDRNTLPQYPDPYYTCKQFSSYDRATKEPGDKNWFANWDRSMFIRTDSLNGRKEYVMMDTEGPGAIVRFWMTFAGQDSGKGILRIYFDNNPKPAIEGSAFDVISGGQLTGAPLSTSVSDLSNYSMRGHNLYLPLPYNKRCKVTYESRNIKDSGARTGGEAVYYNINYRAYRPGTQVLTYSARELEKNRTLLANVQKQLQHRTVVIPYNSQTASLKGDILPGQTLLKKLEGNNEAIRKLLFEVRAANREQALRSTILSISFDGHRTVECPVGDFFGTGYQVRPSSTWYTHVDAEGLMSCFWVMPYRSNCTVTLENRGNQTVSIRAGEITTAPYTWNANTLYFGSSWKQFTHLTTGEFKNNEGGGHPFDINYATLQGKGVYVGDGLTLFNTVDAWWGEGDEKVYIDGEDFPSHIGTGTEDYYGYAWCRPERFSNHPFIAQPDGSGNFHAGYTVNLRFRGLDAIPFSSSLKFDMEMWHWVHATINFAPTTYWYVSPENAIQAPSVLKDAEEPIALVAEDLQVWDQWFKGNTHAHSTYSDGDSSAEEVIKWYREHDYNFLFVTDHNYPLLPDSIYSRQHASFLLIPGNEISDIRAIHSSSLNTHNFLPSIGDYKNRVKNGLLDAIPQTTADVLRLHATNILKSGGLPVLNHPNFLGGVQVADILPVKNLRHLEIFNGHPLVFNEGNEKHSPVEVKWDSLLIHRRLFYGLASDDTHNLKKWDADKANPGRGWIMVRAKKLNTTNIMQAIDRGDFYASTGVILSEYQYDKDAKTISVSIDRNRTCREMQMDEADKSLRFKIQFIGYNGKILHEAEGMHANFTGDKADKYMRVKVICQSAGKTCFAWGQPMELERRFFE